MLLLSAPPPLVDETSNTPAASFCTRVGEEDGAERIAVPTRRDNHSWAHLQMLLSIMHVS